MLDVGHRRRRLPRRLLGNQKVPVLAGVLRVGGIEAGLLANRLEAVARQVVADEVFRQPVRAFVAGALPPGRVGLLDDAQPPTRFERAHEGPEHRVVLAEFVVRVDHQDGIEFAGRQTRVVFRPVHHLHLPQAEISHPLPQLARGLAININRVNLAARANALGQMQREVSRPGANVGGARAGAQPERVHHLLGMLPLVALGGRLPLAVLGTESRDQQANQYRE